jgi:GT2 family glycosyltransferase
VSPHDIARSFAAAPSPGVAVLLPVEEGDQPFVPALLAELARPAAVALELVLADLTLAGDLAERYPDVRVVRATPGSRGGALRAVAAATDAPYVAWQLARAHAAPGRFALQAQALERTPGAELATCDLLVRGADEAAAEDDGWIGAALGGEPAARERIEPFPAEGTPPACWETAVMIRREALADVATTCFAPVELELLRRAPRVHVPEPLACVDAALFAARAERTAHDARLLELAREPHQGAPEITVLLATHDRRDVLLECLEGFSRQLVPPGYLEIVVIDDGSRDGTAELGTALELPVPFTFLRQDDADGASRARILGMPHARGRLVLFVNDDTIPFPDTVSRHVAAHAQVAPRKVTVLGTFEQPEEHLHNALMRMLEDSNYVFCYQGLEAGQELAPAWFYTCNVSVELDAVRDVGGFDPDFSHYGCEDTDLGVRLERAGVPIVYRPECRALHRHRLSFDAICRRQCLVAKAHVRLFEKFPEMLAEHAWWRELTAEELRRRNAGVLPHLERIEAACRALAGVDLTKLADASPACAGTAKRVAERLADLFPKLNKVWWDLGFLEGFEVHGIDGFPALRARARAEEMQHA